MLISGVFTFAGTAAAQATETRIDVIYAGGEVIPAGQIKIFADDPAIQSEKRLAEQQMSIESDGKSRHIEVPVAWTASPQASRTLRIVAHLEREDGWLLARGTAPVEAGKPISIILNKVMY
ncbi:hypothetical protein CFI11_15115 [Thalassococcus sp. S3]|nr:hypothetical protein CFI11_15115 [Thalassococcus sp. S3]